MTDLVINLAEQLAREKQENETLRQENAYLRTVRHNQSNTIVQMHELLSDGADRWAHALMQAGQ